MPSLEPKSVTGSGKSEGDRVNPFDWTVLG